MRHFVYRLLLLCAECGEPVALDGPRRNVTCRACRSTIEIPAATWKNLLGFRQYAAEFQLSEGRTRGSALTDGEFRVLVRWGPDRPRCAACQEFLPEDAVAVGGDESIPCACGAQTMTFPAPEWLRAVEPAAVQLFGAAREPDAAPPPPGATELPASLAEMQPLKPVMFNCPGCGAGLKIAGDAPRILTCQYCDSDLYVPDDLWRALHPLKKRASWWVAFNA